MVKNSKWSYAAEDFIERIETGRIAKEILINSAPDYTSFQEEADTNFYTQVFLQSAAYDLIEECEAVQYVG